MDSRDSIPTETPSSDAPPSPYLRPKTNFMVDMLLSFVPYERKFDPGRKPLAFYTRKPLGCGGAEQVQDAVREMGAGWCVPRGDRRVDRVGVASGRR